MSEPTKLAIVWSSADREVAISNTFMYARNSLKNAWWEKVCLIVWGPSAKLLVQDDELQQLIQELLREGVEVMACKRCSDMFGVSRQLEAIGINVQYVGAVLTKMLKEGWACLTY